MPNHYAIPQTYDHNTDGFSHPDYGGTLAIKSNTLVYTDVTAKSMFTLPVGAVIVMWITNISVVFNGSGTDLLNVGISGTAAKYASGIVVSALGQITTGYVGTQLFIAPLTEEVPVTAIYVDANSDASTGALTLACVYYLSNTSAAVPVPA